MPKEEVIGVSSGLTVSAPTDVHEQEADRVAHEVTGQRDSRGAAPRIRQSASSPAEAGPLPASIDRVVSAGGSALDPPVRQDMERRFNHDFSRVRVHSGADAERSAGNVSADAYTVGQDIGVRTWKVRTWNSYRPTFDRPRTDTCRSGSGHRREGDARCGAHEAA